jgi:phosphonopyruvate decarboxylase
MTVEQRLSTQELYDPLVSNGVDYFCGVPDSITGPFSHFLEDHAEGRHVITANEGNAIGLAIGYHIATGKIPLVYMQNSGLSNAIDPLASLADRSVLSTPMLLLVGWRGQPGKNDESHHTRQGAIIPDLLRSLEIPFDTLSCDPAEANQQVSEMVKNAGEKNRPHALLIEEGGLAEYSSEAVSRGSYQMSREEAVATVVEVLDEDTIVVAGVGKLSRELFEYRQQFDQGHSKDLLVVGGMGHASSIALGIAQQKPEKKVFCFDGDGSVLMHLGALATIGNIGSTNFYHIVFNNGSHDSVGGQPTTRNVDIPAIARACGYRYTSTQSEPELVSGEVIRIQQDIGPALLEVKIYQGARADLTRPSIHPINNKEAFMSFLEEGIYDKD